MDLTEEELANAARVSPRWIEWRRETDLAAYDRRFAEREAVGMDVHGEADFVMSLGPASVLDAGCGTGRVAIELARRGVDVVGVDLDADMVAAARRKAPELDWHVDDLATMALGRSFDVVAMPGNVMLFCRPVDRPAIVANLARHVAPGGRLVAGFTLEPGYPIDAWDADCAAAGLRLVDRFATWDRQPWQAGGTYHVSVHAH
jgi:SAM-dependent methyltransferase